MANGTSTQTDGRGSAFWTLVGIGILAVLLAAAWRVATGAELEAKGKEWSLKVTEAADSLDEAARQLEQQSRQFQEEAANREAYWAVQLAAAKATCPKAITLPSSKVAPKPVPPKISAKTMADVAKTTQAARNAAKDLSKLKVRLF